MDWLASCDPVAYPEAVAWMENRVATIRDQGTREAVWLLEHPALYTAGTSASDAELLDAGRFPVFRSGRGGRFTYHGPGQRVAYVMLDLKARSVDVRRYVQALEAWIIASLGVLGVDSGRRPGRTGVWVAGDAGSEAKIAALGVRVRRWVSYHGVAINVAPELSHFDGIVPCGLSGFGVTSLQALGAGASLSDLDEALWQTFDTTLGCLGLTVC